MVVVVVVAVVLDNIW